MKVYLGERSSDGGWQVWIQDGDRHASRRPLPLRLEVISHSPTGFAWGYGGSGPAQLALAILCDLLGPIGAKRRHQEFKWDMIASLPQSQGFLLTEADIRTWLSRHPPPTGS